MGPFKSGAIAAAAAVAIVVVGFLVGGGEIWRPGFSAGVCYIFSILLGGTAFFAAFTIEKERQPVPKAPEPDGPPYLPEMTGNDPGSKAKMREAVMHGVLEAIKGLVQRSEATEKRLKELEGRVSEVSLAAGLKPRVTRAPGAERPT